MAGRARLSHGETVVLRLHEAVPDEAFPAALSSASVLLESTLSHLQLVREEDLGPLTPDQLRFLAVAEQHAIRLGQVVEDLHLVARCRGEVLAPEWDTVDLAELANAAAAEFAGTAAARGKPIELNADEPSQTLGDVHLLGRLFSGLFAVALDEAAPRLAIRVSVAADGLEVSYSGETLPDASRLGLVLAEALAGLLGGELVASAADGTVSIRFELPLAPARAA
jgi:signal transduction histidine kinase